MEHRMAFVWEKGEMDGNKDFSWGVDREGICAREGQGRVSYGFNMKVEFPWVQVTLTLPLDLS